MKRILTIALVLSMSVILVAGCQNATTLPNIRSSEFDQVAEATADLFVIMGGLDQVGGITAAAPVSDAEKDTRKILSDLERIDYTNTDYFPELSDVKWNVEFTGLDIQIDKYDNLIINTALDFVSGGIALTGNFAGQFVRVPDEDFSPRWLKDTTCQYNDYDWIRMLGPDGNYVLAMDVYGVQYDPDSVAFLADNQDLEAVREPVGGLAWKGPSIHVLDPYNVEMGTPYYKSDIIHDRIEWRPAKFKVFSGNLATGSSFTGLAGENIQLNVAANGNGDMVLDRIQTITISDAVGTQIAYDLDMATGELTHKGVVGEKQHEVYLNPFYPNYTPRPGEEGDPSGGSIIQEPPTNQ